ncbi:MAG TPA: hypothetical protein DIT35_03725 [Rhodospirillaceae bacterium]|nr:hypothetical protein [Rhodospirillaceae bacterium]|tara:strand:- start:317 stop:985 length:669 start_codon:yes stop_codon:yes gene_type:complete
MGHLPLTIFVTVAISGLFALAFELGSAPVIVGIALLALLIVFAAITPSTSDSPPTAGTRFTVARVAMTCLIGGLAVVPAGNPPEPLLWSLALMGIVAAGLGAIDGWLARITCSNSGFSERLGGLAGTLLVLALALLVWRLGLVGPWIIAAGALGFAEAAMLAGQKNQQRETWQIGATLLVRLALAIAIIPDVPQLSVTMLALLATSVAVGLLGYTLVDRLNN